MNKILFLCLFSGLLAQDNFMEKRKQRSDRMESMLVWRLTDELDLSPEQAEKFFPLHREHRKEILRIREEERAYFEELREKIDDDKELSKADAENTIDRVSVLRKKLLELESSFILGLNDVLSPNQMIKLSVYKEMLMEEMRHNIKDSKRDKKYKKNHKMKRGRKPRYY